MCVKAAFKIYALNSSIVAIKIKSTPSKLKLKQAYVLLLGIEIRGKKPHLATHFFLVDRINQA